MQRYRTAASARVPFAVPGLSRAPQLTPKALTAAIAAVLGGVSLQSPALAQEPAIEEIQITGSRIVRRDFEANSPIQTINFERLEESSTIAVESVMNQLPQFVPAITQFSPGGTYQGTTRTPGSSTLSLRGLGAGRNLVLIDGRRAMPINASMAVSTNTIPSAAIERVETITGGASSVYGADAMSGVVNFIFKRDFEGVDINTHWSNTDEGGGKELMLSALIGTNFADDRGNIMFGLDYSDRDLMYTREREFYRRGWADPWARNTTTGFFDPPGIQGETPVNRPSQAALNQVFGNIGVSPNHALYQNWDGSMFAQSGPAIARYTGPLLDAQGVPRINGQQVPFDQLLSYGRFQKLDPQDNQLRTQFVPGLAQSPLDRWSAFSRVRFDLDDNLSAFANFMFNDSTSGTGVTGPALMTGGWRTYVPHGNGIYEPSRNADGSTNVDYLAGGKFGLNCAPVGGCTKSQAFPLPAEWAYLMDNRPRPEEDAHIKQNLWWFPKRGSTVDTQMYQFVVGVEGDLPSLDWTWEAYASYGEAHTLGVYSGMLSLERYRYVSRQPNFGRNMYVQGNELAGFFAAATSRCTSGLPIVWGVSGYGPDFVPSDDCIDAIAATPKMTGEMGQTIGEFNMQGPLAEMPAGELLFALGASYRENTLLWLADPLNHNQGFLDQVGGAHPLGDANGRTVTNDAYGELVVPLLTDKPGFQHLNLELGYRYSHQAPADNVDSYKALLDWGVTDRVRLRGGRQVANRAPNIGELFQSAEQLAPFSSFGDWCSDLNPVNVLSPNPAINKNGAAGAAAARQLCYALMGQTGADYFYSDPFRPNTATQGRLSYLSGNPELHSEGAETFTFGVVADITDQARLSFDYWRIELSDLIAAQLPDVIYSRCFDPDENPGLNPAFQPCTQVVRNPDTGANADTLITFTNEGAVDTSGYDVQFDWSGAVGPGNMTVNFLWTWTEELATRPNPQSAWRDWVGTNGPTDLTSIDPYVFQYRTFTTVGYSAGSWTGSLRWRHLPSIIEATATPVSQQTKAPTASYDIFDAAGRYDLRANMQLRFGIDNLFDREPEETFYDILANIPATGQTNARFYDILGRRYYVGFNIRL
jgi:outer membrane receptor for ferrienterochelin and colicin